MLRKLRRLSKLSPSELLVFSQLLLFAVGAHLALRFLALPRISAFIAWGANQRLLRWLPLLQNNYDIEQLTPLADLAARATRPDGPCLLRSLLLFWLLKTRGEPAELLIGVRKEGTVLSSHAWVKSHGKIVADTVTMTGGFATLLRF
jgi:transglutaminase superfamily protein